MTISNARFASSKDLIHTVATQYAGKGTHGGIGWLPAIREHPEWAKQIFGTEKPSKTDFGTWVSYARRTTKNTPIGAGRRRRSGPSNVSPYHPHGDLIRNLLSKYTTTGGRMMWSDAFTDDPELKRTLLDPSQGKTQSALYSYVDAIRRKEGRETARRKARERAPRPPADPAANGAAPALHAPPLRSAPRSTATPAPSLNYCPFCGVNARGSNFCSGCGTDLKNLAVAIDIALRYKAPRTDIN
jgi:hypothetical protein